MNDTLRMQVLQCLAQLVDVVSCSLLCVSSIRLLLQFLVQFSSRSILQDQVDLLIIPEEAIHSQDIVVSQVWLNFYLSSQLMLIVTLHQLLLVHHLQGYYELWLPLSGKVHMTELASTQWLAYLEVIYSPLFVVVLSCSRFFFIFFLLIGNLIIWHSILLSWGLDLVSLWLWHNLSFF
jgi:hypothetical protein